MFVYADNAATTKISKRALEKMNVCYKEFFGNPSSLHSAGQKAKTELDTARETIAKIINANPAEIYFTSGGSEADNQAIISAARLGAKKGKKHLISSKFEHHAVLHTLGRLAKEGFEVTLLDVSTDGMVDPAAVKAAIRPDTALVTIMAVNNEIGTIQPVQEIGEICHSAGVIFHTDAVQAAGHINIDVKEMCIDMLSLAAHKFHGPRGAGVLYCKKGIPLTNIIDGGMQERGKRAGTENLPAISAMAEALTEAYEKLDEKNAYISKIRDRLISGILEIPHTILNGNMEHHIAGTINFCFEGIEGESLLLLLDDKGIEASSGSACTSGSLEPSHVLLALGLPHEIAHGSLRLSINEENTPEQADYIIKSLKEIVAYLRSMSPVWENLEKGKQIHLI